MRHGYIGYEVRKLSTTDAYYELIGFAEVNHSLGGGHDGFIGKLHDWALDLLRAGRHEAGLYWFGYCAIDADDDPGTPLATLDLAWDGTREITASPEPSVTPAGASRS